jgi:hypothetical protein
MTVEEAERILGPELTAQIRATTPRPPLSPEQIIRATALFLEEPSRLAPARTAPDDIGGRGPDPRPGVPPLRSSQT